MRFTVNEKSKIFSKESILVYVIANNKVDPFT